MKSIHAIYNDGNNVAISVKAPDVCPLCHHAIDPIIHFAFCDRQKPGADNCLQVIFRCTKNNCLNLFIANYSAVNSDCRQFKYSHSVPLKKVNEDFGETIKKISPNFCDIYNQALAAEQDNLREICGVGYRKAIEFLIKDYLIKQTPDKEEEIKKAFLGTCIDKKISNDNLKAMAKRATWLGNDETHYLKKWEGKDLEDLKKLIKATIYWIEMEELTKESKEDMPEN